QCDLHAMRYHDYDHRDIDNDHLIHDHHHDDDAGDNHHHVIHQDFDHPPDDYHDVHYQHVDDHGAHRLDPHRYDDHDQHAALHDGALRPSSRRIERRVYRSDHPGSSDREAHQGGEAHRPSRDEPRQEGTQAPQQSEGGPQTGRDEGDPGGEGQEAAALSGLCRSPEGRRR